MTNNQKQVLNHMYENNIGALPLNGTWIFPCRIEASTEIADQLHVRIFGKEVAA